MNNPYIKLISTPNKVDVLQVTHPKFTAQISRFGGHLLSYATKQQDNYLWLSNTAVLDGSKAIRGGVPICWPWFGPAQGEFSGEPQHGYIRNVNWQLQTIEGDDTELTLELAPELSDELKEKLGLSARIRFHFKDDLTITLSTTNECEQPRPLSQAIHSYFYVRDINNTKLMGLENSQYIDKLTNTTETQHGAVQISGSVDRVYLSNAPKLMLDDESRKIIISGSGHDSVVVWNPWRELAANMADFDDNGYQTMICVEMANTQGLTLAPGKTYHLSQTIGG